MLKREIRFALACDILYQTNYFATATNEQASVDAQFMIPNMPSFVKISIILLIHHHVITHNT